MQSVLSTALSRLNAFLDSEMEQILCFDTAVDAEKFCNTKSAIFLIMPEEDNTKYFLISLDSIYTKCGFCGIIGVLKRGGKERWKVSIIDMT